MLPPRRPAIGYRQLKDQLLNQSVGVSLDTPIKFLYNMDHVPALAVRSSMPLLRSRSILAILCKDEKNIVYLLSL